MNFASTRRSSREEGNRSVASAPLPVTVSVRDYLNRSRTLLKRQHLIQSCAGVQQREREGVQSPLVKTPRLPFHELGYLRG